MNLGIFKEPKVSRVNEPCSSGTDLLTRGLLDTFSDLGLFQHICVSIRITFSRASILELVISLRSSNVQYSDYLPPAVASDHFALGALAMQSAATSETTSQTQLLKSGIRGNAICSYIIAIRLEYGGPASFPCITTEMVT